MMNRTSFITTQGGGVADVVSAGGVLDVEGIKVSMFLPTERSKLSDSVSW